MYKLLRQKYLLIITAFIMMISCLNPVYSQRFFENVSAVSSQENGSVRTCLKSSFRSWQCEDALTGETFRSTREDFSRVSVFGGKHSYNLEHIAALAFCIFELIVFSLSVLYSAVFLHTCVGIKRLNIVKYIHLKDGAKAPLFGCAL